MEKLTDWLLLWRQIIEENGKTHKYGRAQGKDLWEDRAERFDGEVKKRWKKPDSSRTLILERLMRNPGSTVIDIGAGTGAWTCIMAPHASRVIAVEPSGAMARYLERNVREAGFSNVEIVRESWPEARVDPCDFSLCSHAMYGSPDFEGFVVRMEEVTGKSCFLLLKVPETDGVMAQAAMRVWGQPHDSPNFHIAYNALLRMGILPNVLMEDSEPWKPWVHAGIDDALTDVKRKLGIAGETVHDGFLRDLLERRLVPGEQGYVWPKGPRSALVYWDVGHDAA